jgi:hypothetical protein
MTKTIDYHALTLEALQEAHSRLCAAAFDAGVKIPEHLTVDFDTADQGAEICTELDPLLGVASGHDTMVEDGTTVKPPKKPRAKTAPTGESTMTDTITITNVKKPKAKKTAKKVVKKAKKVAKKTNGAKKAKATGENKTAKVIALMKRAKGVTRAEVLELTGWKAVSMQQLAENAGVKLVVDESARPFHYKVKAA